MSITGDNLIVELLELHGVNHIFGLPDEGISRIYDAVERSDKIQYVSAQSAQAASLMADGYSRATGNIGVCHLFGGHASVCAAAGIAAAYADNVPLLLITEQLFADDSPSQTPVSRHRQPSDHVDLQKLFDSVTKWNWRVENPEEIRRTIGQALEFLELGRPGPVHLEIPFDTLESELAEFYPSKGSVSRSAPLASYLNMLASHLNTLAAEMLTYAKYPIIIAGGGVVSAGAGMELVQLAEILKAPVFVTPMSKGIIPSTHPLSAGLIGAVGDDSVSALVEQANAVLSIGCSLSQRTAENWQLQLPKDLVQIDIEEKAIGRNYPVRIGIVADAKTALGQIIRVIEEEELETQNEWKIPTRKLQSFVIPGSHRNTNQEIVCILRSVLDEESIVGLSGNLLIDLMLTHFDVNSSRTLLHSCDLRAAGYALPAAIGAKVAHPDRQVLAITDSNDFSLLASDLTTALRYDIDIPIIVISNQHRNEQSDVVKLAGSVGLDGFRVERIDELKTTLESALLETQSPVVDIPLLV